MSDILAQVATNTESLRNTGNSILYECVQTIMNIESSGGLRVLGINILGRFLSNKDNNIRYVALNTLSKVVTIDAQAVQRHRETIVECVKDADVSIRKIALELVYSLVNEHNIKTLTKELLEYLSISDAEFKPDLTSKICMLIQRFSPDKRWHVDNMIKILIQAGRYVKPEIGRSFVVLITNANTLQPYTVRALYVALRDHVQLGHASLITISCWCMGEYGEFLLTGHQLLEDEMAIAVTEQDIVDLLERVLQLMSYDVTAKEYGLTALMKLAPKLPSETQRIRSLLERYRSDVVAEVQQRCCEYIKILSYDQLHPQLFEKMPPLDEKQYAENLGMGETLPVENGRAENGATATAPAQVHPLHKTYGTDIHVWMQDLLGLDDILDTDPESVQPNAALDILDDLMSPSRGDEATTSTTSPPATVDLLDMLTTDTTVLPILFKECVIERGFLCRQPRPNRPRRFLRSLFMRIMASRGLLLFAKLRRIRRRQKSQPPIATQHRIPSPNSLSKSLSPSS